MLIDFLTLKASYAKMNPYQTQYQVRWFFWNHRCLASLFFFPVISNKSKISFLGILAAKGPGLKWSKAEALIPASRFGDSTPSTPIHTPPCLVGIYLIYCTALRLRGRLEKKT